VIAIILYKSLPLKYYVNDVKSKWVRTEALFLLFSGNSYIQQAQILLKCKKLLLVNMKYILIRS